MYRFFSKFISVVLSLILSVVLPLSPVFADQIVNNVDATIDANLEVMNLISGGSNGSVTYTIHPTILDGENGCNLDTGESLIVSVNTSNASVVTASPTSLTFSGPGCGATRTISVTPVGVGSANITLSQISNNAGSTFDLNTASFTVNVGAAPTPTPTNTPTPTPIPDGTAPVITPTVVGILGNNGWYTSNVKVTWDVVDNESAIDSQTGCGETNITSDTTGTTLTCSATSTGGTSSESVTIKRDATAPTITYVDRTSANLNGWNNSDVVVDWDCSDATSGAVASPIHQTITTEGEDQLTTGICTDLAGNTASDFQEGINIDITKPVISGSTSPAAVNGWNNTDVTAHFTCEDTGLVQSIIDTDTLSDVVLSTEGLNQSITNTGTCVDKAGNVANSLTFNNISIDKTAPESQISLDGTLGNNNWYTSNVDVTLSATDNLSDVDTTEYSTDNGSTWTTYVSPFTLSTEGTTTISYRSTDVAGNTETTQTKIVKIDKTAPTLNPTVNPNPVLLNGIATATAGATDSVSGVDTQGCDSVITSVVGAHSVNCTATDKAGNTTNKDANYNVNYRFDGFLQPINDTAHQIGLITSIFKGGSTVPAKFQLKDANGNIVQSSTAPEWIGYIRGGSTSLSVDEAAYTAVATGGSTYRWDSSSQQYIYNWSTKGVAAGFYYKVGVKFDDGQTYYVNLGLR